MRYTVSLAEKELRRRRERQRDLEENLTTLRRENKKKQDRIDAANDTSERRKADEIEMERDKNKQLKLYNNLHSDYAALQRQLKDSQDALRDTRQALDSRTASARRSTRRASTPS